MPVRVQKHFSIEDFREMVQNLSYDPLLESYKENLLGPGSPGDIMVFPNQFFYISDFHDVKNHTIHPNSFNILGYHPEQFSSFGFIYEHTHPDDRDFVLAFSMKTIEQSRLMKDVLLKDRLSAVFSIDFRVKHALGHTVRLNRNTCCYRLDREGNMTYALSLFTDISHLKKTSCITYSWAGRGTESFNIDDILCLNGKIELSDREMGILECFSSGMDGSAIADRLHISEHTVITHRKNMLRKMDARNTTEMVNKAYQAGIL
ncbi:MAG: LuxR C-terminal-related transcriptional regulator [Bacteroidales bacterium]